MVHCYPHRTSWVRGASDYDQCAACVLEKQMAELQRRLDVCKFGSEDAADEFNRRGELISQYEAKFTRVETAVAQMRNVSEQASELGNSLTAGVFAAAADHIEGALRGGS